MWKALSHVMSSLRLDARDNPRRESNVRVLIWKQVSSLVRHRIGILQNLITTRLKENSTLQEETITCSAVFVDIIHTCHSGHYARRTILTGWIKRRNKEQASRTLT